MPIFVNLYLCLTTKTYLYFVGMQKININYGNYEASYLLPYVLVSGLNGACSFSLGSGMFFTGLVDGTTLTTVPVLTKNYVSVFLSVKFNTNDYLRNWGRQPYLLLIVGLDVYLSCVRKFTGQGTLLRLIGVNFVTTICYIGQCLDYDMYGF